MLKTGTCFCYKCGNVFKDAYYKNTLKSVGAKLTRSAFYLGKPRWKLTPFRKDGKPISPEERPKFAKFPAPDELVPQSVFCQFGTDTQSFELRRCCPCCNEDTNLPDTCGKYPTYVVAMVGETQAGKTTWLKSISTGSSLQAVNGEAAYPYMLDFSIHHNELDYALGATPEESSGTTNVLSIIDKATDETVACVIFRDFSGELAKLDTKPSLLRTLFIKNGSFPGIDAVVYIESLKNLLMGERKDVVDKDGKPVVPVKMQVCETNFLKGKPVAFVYSHADYMLEAKSHIPKITDISGHQVPLCPRNTFKRRSSYAPADLLPRIALENRLARNLERDILTTANKKSKGFMVQTCIRTTDSQGTPCNDLAQNFNIMDPLLWLLNALQLFPLPSIKE